MHTSYKAVLKRQAELDAKYAQALARLRARGEQYRELLYKHFSLK